MIKLNNLLNRIRVLIHDYKKSYSFYGRYSSSNFVEYLRHNDVIVGDNVAFRYPNHTKIDLTRPWLITIGNNCDFNDNFAIMTHDFMSRVFRELYHDYIPSGAEVKIGNNCTFGRNVLVTRGVQIGDNCCIGAGSIVTKSIEANSLAAGIPCKRICSIEEYYERRKKQCVEEAILNGVAYYKRYGVMPTMEVFNEEWALFMNKEDLKAHPEMHKHIDFRLKGHFDKFFENQKRPFNGFDDFIHQIEAYLKDNNHWDK